MRKYILKRIILIIPTVLGVGVLVFFLMRVIPGDTCLFKWVDFGTHLDPTLLEICRNEQGLNDPIYLQFLEFLTGILTLDFGISMWTGQPITEEFGHTIDRLTGLGLVETSNKYLRLTDQGLMLAR